jgi:hypothetical protein
VSTCIFLMQKQGFLLPKFLNYLPHSFSKLVILTLKYQLNYDYAFDVEENDYHCFYVRLSHS